MRKPQALKFPVSLADVTCADLVPGGAGIAHVEFAGERRAVFVQGAAPGDRLQVTIESDGRPLRATIDTILDDGPARRATPCAIAARCGGCDWMHLTPTARPALYAQLLEDAWPDTLDLPAITFHGAESRLRTRTHARLAVDVRSGVAVVGFHAPRSHKLVVATDCLALAPALEVARQQFGDLLKGSRGEGQLQLSLGRAQSSPRRAVAHLTFRGSLHHDVFGRMEAAVGAHGFLQGIVVVEEGSLKPAIVGDATTELLGFDDKPIAMPVAGFQQASESGNRMLAAHVASLARALAEKHREAPRFPIVELYAGAGNLSVGLAPHARALTTVESSPDATALAQGNLQARSLKAKVVTADAATFVWEKGTRLLVLDPPREGAMSVARSLVANPVPYVIYVACDPVALARDAATLGAAGYRATHVDQFELFPETSHVEAVALFERARG
jgi:23S rRNA (uracil1939-C5)-methyltransferase